MGWFKKKEEKVPELPGLPPVPGPASNESIQLPEVPPGIKNSQDFNLPLLPESEVKDIEVNPLPALPEPPGKKSDQRVIKQEVFSPLPPSKEIIPVKEMNLGPRTIEIPSAPSEKIITKGITKKLEPIYVRLDKFETTVSAFEEIKSKVTEIEDILAKVKDIKQKEEAELEEWEREIQVIKARIEAIDKNIFNKLD